MTSTNSPLRQERRDIRYPLQLPVSVKLAHKEIRARSENVSLGGILLSSAFLIPEGSVVEVALGVTHLPEPGTLLSARGKVVRVQPRATGDFAVAVKLERAFEIPLDNLTTSPVATGKGSHLEKRHRIAANRDWHFALAWHTET